MITKKNKERNQWEITISFHEIKKLKIGAIVLGSLMFILFSLAVYSIYHLESEKQENELHRNQLKMANDKLGELEEKIENVETLSRALTDYVKPSEKKEKSDGTGGASTIPDKANLRKKLNTPGELLYHIYELDTQLNKDIREFISVRSLLLSDEGNNYPFEKNIKGHTPNMWPVVGPISSYYGYRESPGGIGSTFHEGVDITGEYGTPIQATATGVVTKAGWVEGYGYMVEINHGEGYSTRYAHNSIVFVKEGEPVEQGAIIALMGSTGNSTGTHCHYEVRINGDSVNPIYFLPGAIQVKK